MISGGLAFFEESDMRRLRKNSLRGWHVKKFSFLGYSLENGEPKDVIYTIDYHLLKEADKEEYFDMFELAGWGHVCTEYNMHIFKAPLGTKPIYSDSDTKKEKYVRLSKLWRNASILLLALYIISLLINLKAVGTLHQIGSVGIMLSFTLLIPSCMTYIAILSRILKNKSKTE